MCIIVLDVLSPSPHPTQESRWFETIRSLSDPAMVIDFLGHCLRTERALETVEELRLILFAAQRRDEHAQRVWLFTTCALARSADSDRTRLVEAAKERGLFDLATAIGSREAARSIKEDQIVKDPRGLSLGERKTLARKPTPALIERALRDSSADVVQILLQNPSLTETRVVWLASKRPCDPQILFEIAKSAKWIASSRVRNAIVRNPYALGCLSIPLLVSLRGQDWKEVARSETLLPALRQFAQRMLQIETPH